MLDEHRPTATGRFSRTWRVAAATRIMGGMKRWALLLATIGLAPVLCSGQVSSVARFSLEAQSVLAGEPLFCDFTLQNTGPRAFAISFRTPRRVVGQALEQEPHFVVTAASGAAVPDPAARRCGGEAGTAVYGYATLPPGHQHLERWLLNQWAQFSRSGHYRIRAERRLPLYAVEAGTVGIGKPPVAFESAQDEFSLEVVPPTEGQLQAAFQPYLKALREGSDPEAAEAALVVTTLPHPFLLETLEWMLEAPTGARSWDRKQALEGLARLATGPAWESIAKVARGNARSRMAASSRSDDALRAYAILLLGERADPAWLPTLLEILPTAPPELRLDVLRALGYFRDPRANQVLFEKLHSPMVAERANAILGLKNLESREAIPALLAMLNDPEAQVRQVAHFALQSLTGVKIAMSSRASPAESRRVAAEWHAWWQKNAATFTPVHQPACHDW